VDGLRTGGINGDTMSPPTYHSARHDAKIDNVKVVYKTALEVVARLPPPWPKAERGRKPKLSSRGYFAACLVYIYFNLTYREMEALAPFFSNQCIDHSTFGKNFKRLSLRYVLLVLRILRKKLKNRVDVDFYFVDSTGISTPHLKTRVKALRKVKEHEFYKVHILAGYSGEKKALVVFAARVTKPNVSDGSQLPYLIREVDGESKPLLGDSAYDWEQNIHLAMKHGFKPLFKPRATNYHGIFRRMVVKDFKRNRKLYRKRGIGEAVFAGIENRYGAHTRCKRAKTKVLSILMMLVAHNLRTLMRLEAEEKRVIFLFVGIFRQTRLPTYSLHKN
jgi:hypothetical protein